MSTQENSRLRRAAGAPLIREPSVQVGAPGVNRLLLIPAALLSAVVNGGLLFGLMLLPNPSQAGAQQKPRACVLHLSLHPRVRGCDSRLCLPPMSQTMNWRKSHADRHIFSPCPSPRPQP